ncbi:MAG TPA: hypothetical protein VFY16_09920, partial [Gemmatimonadaceae bacterium]|nr:hypothetical protein [Gemmatimonadaceae bacterium]
MVVLLRVMPFATARRAAAGALLALAAMACRPAPPATPPTPEAAPPGERWWKGNLHTHSLWSDGDGFPDMVADWYRERGYHFLSLTDHNVL